VAPAPAPVPSPAPAAAPAPASPDDQAGYWPADWRARAAGGDAEAAKALGRYATPTELAKALKAAQAKLSEVDTRLPKNPSPEELADWRKSRGIPESPDKYDLDLGNGIVVGELDKPLVDDFLKIAHQVHLTPDQNKAVLRAYYAAQEKVTEARAADDVKIKEQCEENLREEWGKEFRANINRAVQMLDRVGEPGLADQFLSGRLADGTPIGSSPAALKMLLGLALIENPTGVLVPQGAGPGGVDDEIKSIESFMRKNRDKYNKDEKMQARYRDLLEAREKLQSRAKAA